MVELDPSRAEHETGGQAIGAETLRRPPRHPMISGPAITYQTAPPLNCHPNRMWAASSRLATAPENPLASMRSDRWVSHRNDLILLAAESPDGNISEPWAGRYQRRTDDPLTPCPRVPISTLSSSSDWESGRSRPAPRVAPAAPRSFAPSRVSYTAGSRHSMQHLLALL